MGHPFTTYSGFTLGTPDFTHYNPARQGNYSPPHPTPLKGDKQISLKRLGNTELDDLEQKKITQTGIIFYSEMIVKKS